MKIRVPAMRLTVYVSNGDLWHHQPLAHEIMRQARVAGFNGASSFEGVSGFGATSQLHRKKNWALFSKYPVAITIIDREERIRSFIPVLDEIITEGVVTLESCEMIRYYRDDRG